MRARGYYDIFLFDADGNLVYTVFKESDFATNLVTGPWKDSDLGSAFRAARDNPRPGFQAFFDFKAYAPSNGAPAAFVSTPVLGADGHLLGVFAVQMPIGEMNTIMQDTAGLGETGETYLVGGDRLMRSNSRFSEEPTLLKRTVDTEAVRLALKGESDVALLPDYRGETVFSAYQPLTFAGVTWAMLAEIGEAELLAPVAAMRTFMLTAGGPSRRGRCRRRHLLRPLHHRADLPNDGGDGAFGRGSA